MYGVSDDFKVAIRYSHNVITKAEVLRDGQVLAQVYPESGSVEIDSRRAQRRTCQISLHAGGISIAYSDTYNTYANLNASYATYTAFKAAVQTYADAQVITGQVSSLVDDGLIPDSGQDLLTPYGNELRLYRGLRYKKLSSYTYSTLSSTYATYTALKNGVSSYEALIGLSTDPQTIEELVPLGVFPITNVSIDQDEDGVQLSVSGVDRALRISRNRWREPYQIASGTNVGTALTALLQDRWADISLKFSDTTATTSAITLGVDADNDPWADAQQIAEAAAMDLYFDADGNCVLEPSPDISVAASVEQYNQDAEAMVLTTGRTLSADGIYNTVVVTAEGSDTDVPYRSTAFDDNPASPTYVYGPFGFAPTFRSSPLIKNQAQADAYAVSELNKLRGTDEALEWSQIVDPSLDAGDVVSIVNVTAKIARAIILDRLNIPLDPGSPMSAQGRTIVYQVGDTVVTAGGEAVAVYAPDRSTTAVGSGDSSSTGTVIRTQSLGIIAETPVIRTQSFSIKVS